MFSLTILMTAALAAAPVAQELADAKAAEADLDYQRAKILLVSLLNRSDLGEQQKLEARFLAGQIERILGNDTEARLHFFSVLTKNPDYPLAADTPPKVSTFFELVREEVRERRRQEEALAKKQAEPPSEPPKASGPPLGAIVAGSGAAILVAGGAAGVFGEVMFAATDTPFKNRATGRTLALVGWAGAAVGALVGVGGAALLVAGGGE